MKRYPFGTGPNNELWRQDPEIFCIRESAFWKPMYLCTLCTYVLYVLMYFMYLCTFETLGVGQYMCYAGSVCTEGLSKVIVEFWKRICLNSINICLLHDNCRNTLYWSERSACDQLINLGRPLLVREKYK